MSSIGSKKNLPSSTEGKRRLVDPEIEGISVRRQCELLNLNRSAFYYQAKGDSETTRFLVREIDKIYTEHPFFGTRRIAAELGRRFPELKVTRKRVGRLMRKMGIEAVYPKPRLSIGNHEHSNLESRKIIASFRISCYKYLIRRVKNLRTLL